MSRQIKMCEKCQYPVCKGSRFCSRHHSEAICEMNKSGYLQKTYPLRKFRGDEVKENLSETRRGLDR